MRRQDMSQNNKTSHISCCTFLNWRCEWVSNPPVFMHLFNLSILGWGEGNLKKRGCLKKRFSSRWQSHVTRRQRKQTAVINKGNRWDMPHSTVYRVANKSQALYYNLVVTSCGAIFWMLPCFLFYILYHCFLAEMHCKTTSKNVFFWGLYALLLPLLLWRTVT